MTENDFLDKWHSQLPAYKAWGDVVVSEISQTLQSRGWDLGQFLKQQVLSRVKSDESLVDKAFYRPSKNYKNPYDDIEDKVGCRFVVLLVEHVDEVSEIIKSSDLWSFKECRHFNEERKKQPLLFTYQSVHYVVRSKGVHRRNDVYIPEGIPCEIQVRTLLQHAYAELTHDAIYKSKTLVEPEVQRTVAKSMALIETTDEFFSNVNNKLNNGAQERFSLKDALDSLYEKYVGAPPCAQQKSSLVLLDVFSSLIKEDTVDNLETLLKEQSFIVRSIQAQCKVLPFFNQSIVIFVFWLVLKKRHRTLEDWPLDYRLLEQVSSQAGVSLDN
ncbi:GTP pyrophosphokinase [Vibrio owensii]|uniref:GTP pyrophosphokinase n=1 Tax=Vibrio owensii TaxID=696485 RepID=UPI00215D06F5|nr:hypothetical protein [Vibrio owensii]MCR9943793.1 hypothetical protein [Vibrio owensii]